jgi:hypothetical protein
MFFLLFCYADVKNKKNILIYFQVKNTLKIIFITFLNRQLHLKSSPISSSNLYLNGINFFLLYIDSYYKPYKTNLTIPPSLTNKILLYK